MSDISQQIQHQISEANTSKVALKIQSGNSKPYYGRNITGEVLDVSSHTGIISYEPTELFITARSGTTLEEIENTLNEQHQQLAFEPPRFSQSATIGGTVACNLSGPSRAYLGACRDYVLGCHIVNGKAEKLKFGGEVMKNVAGYDASRLMCGAHGTLGVLLDVSLKVIPKPAYTLSLSFECNTHQAMKLMHTWVNESHPLSATYYNGKTLVARLSGNKSAVKSSHQKMGGDLLNDDGLFWQDVKEQENVFFNSNSPIWRISLASNTSEIALQGETLYEWGGALRWFKSNEEDSNIRDCVESLGGHASLVKNNPGNIEPFHPLNKSLHQIQKNIKQAFDPNNILNAGRMYKDI